jgi:hypothetical protein
VAAESGLLRVQTSSVFGSLLPALSEPEPQAAVPNINPATVAPATVAPATVAPATVAPATVAPATVAPATVAAAARRRRRR